MANPKSNIRLVMPGDKGYDEKKQYPWSGIYESLGMKTPGFHSTVDGFYLMDKRFTPPMAIFKNCVIPCRAGYKPPLDGPPEVFNSPREAWLVRERMHLSETDGVRVEIHALVLDPGIGAAKPDCVIYDKKEFLAS